MAKRLLAESTADWRASPKTASEFVSMPTANFTMTTTILATRIPPRTRRTPDDLSRAFVPRGMVEVGKSRFQSLEPEWHPRPRSPRDPRRLRPPGEGHP